MLQIKNTLGGGKPNAPYAWAKYTKVFQAVPEEQTNVDIVSTSVSGGDTFVYYSDTYTYDDSTGNFSIGDDAPYVRANSGSSGWDGLRGKYVIQELGSKGFSAKTGKVLIKIGESATFFQSNNHYVYDYALATSDATVYVYADVYTFIEYVTDKSPTKYPNGEVHTDGYFYRYAPEGLYAWKKYSKNNSPTYSQKSLKDLPVDCAYGRCVIFNDNIYMVSPNADTSVYLYDESTDSWSVAATIPYTCGLYPSVCVYNNELHVMGGNDNRTKHYAWNGVSWREVSTLPYNVYTTDSVVYDNKLHIIGGNPSPTLHYSWDGTAWTSESTLPYTFNGGAAIIYENAIHILGTGDGSGVDRHYVYNNDGSWTKSFDLPYAFSNAGVCVFDNHIYVCGGYKGEAKFYRWNGSSWESLYTLKENFIGNAKTLVSYHDKLYLIGNNKSSFSYKHAYILAAYEYSIFISYIVSDKETAYPDGGEKGGYWYEKFGGFLTGTITQTTSNQKTLSFEYGSVKTPKAFYLMHMGGLTGVNYLVYNTWYDESQGLNNGAYAYYASPYIHYEQGTGSATCSATFSDGVVTLGGNNYYRGTYLWVAIF